MHNLGMSLTQVTEPTEPSIPGATPMRAMLLAVVLATTVLAVPTISFSAGDCDELRLACENKRALGEQGEGNCRRYRACLQRVCAELRSACLHKRELGERGEGNCRRYRETCRS